MILSMNETVSTKENTYDAYVAIFQANVYPDYVQNALRDSFMDCDDNKMQAAIDVLAECGDYGIITTEIANAIIAGHLSATDESGNTVPLGGALEAFVMQMSKAKFKAEPIGKKN